MPLSVTNAPVNTGRRKVLLAGAWTVPVIAAAIAAPSAAASGEPDLQSALSYSISEVNTAWEGTNAVTITNMGTGAFSGTLWFLGEIWDAPLTAAGFSLNGTVGELVTVDGVQRVLYGPVAATVPPTGAAVEVVLDWHGYPFLSVGTSNDARNLEVFTTDPRISANAVPATGGTAVRPPLLTFTVTPVADTSTGTEQVVLYNGNNQDYVGNVLLEVDLYKFPMSSYGFEVVYDSVTYQGAKVLSVAEKRFLSRTIIPVAIPAGGTFPLEVVWAQLSSSANGDLARPLRVRLDATAHTILTGSGDVNVRAPISV
ncbi:hypothetical protein ART_4052 [Arthrobacter sp. PAMC 25486]|uniref:hypothetical protein n=1 Tax=Arthrobacter sp. PAMC 25486 TaxID=1494608 RepID=UPI000535B2F9|nr:hypothetical protein [Arthrobacter sp. PAMC 25486]AIY03651.1 hypothetical protein ART_4052 [Arthrobacter sp. PAMC 25486]